MKTALPDVNVLIAMAWPNHENHRIAREWFSDEGRKSWATCPMTQAGFIRISSNPVIVDDAAAPETARKLLTHLSAMPGHRFWPDDLDFTQMERIPAALFHGHRQATDAYLLMLAAAHNGRLVTLDKGLVNAVVGLNLESSLMLLSG